MFVVRQVITVAAAALICAAPFSIDRSPRGGVSLSLDSAHALVKRTTRRAVAGAYAQAFGAGEGAVYCKDTIGVPPVTCIHGEDLSPRFIGPMPPPAPLPSWGTLGFGEEAYPQPPSKKLWDAPF